MPLLAAEDAKNPASVPPSAQITMTQQSIRDQVKAMRQQRYDQMPYLNRSFIRSEIKPQKIKEKTKFLSGDDEKNLRAVISRAIAVYIPVRAAKERISLAQRRLLIAIRGLFPDAKFEFNDKTGAIPSGLTPADFNSRQYRFSFRQPVFRGGILWNTLLKEKATLESERKDYQAIVEDLVKEVSEGYLEYNRALAVYRDQEMVLKKMEKIASISKQKYDNQLISEIEHLNVQSLFGQIRYEHETAKQEKELAKLDLERYLDLSNADPLTVAPLYNVESLLEKERGKEASVLTESAVADLAEPAGLKGEVEAPDLATLTDLAYQHRAKLRTEASKLDAARLDEKIKWGELMPQVDVVMEFGALGEAYDSIGGWHPKLNKGSLVGVEFNWNVGGNKIEYKHTAEERPPSITAYNQLGAYSKIDTNSFSVGLFDGLSDLAATKEAEINKLNQVNELDKAEKEVLHDVKEAYFSYQKAKIQVKSALQGVDYKERMARISEHKLGKNEVQISDYIGSENELLNERIKFHKALADYFKAKAQLNHAVGVRDYLPLEEWYGSESPKFGPGPVKAQTKKSN